MAKHSLLTNNLFTQKIKHFQAFLAFSVHTIFLTGKKYMTKILLVRIKLNLLYATSPGPEGYKLFSYSTQLSRKFILLINVKMPLIVGIITFISMINTTSERLEARHFFICRYFSFYEHLKFRAQLSKKKVL